MSAGERGDSSGGLQGHPRLADTAWAGESDQPGRLQQRLDLGHRLLTPDQLADLRGQVRPRRRPWRSGQGRVLLEDPAVESGDLRPWVQAQFLTQPRQQVGVGLEGVALPAGAVQGAHVRGAEAFAQRMAFHQVAQFARQGT